ncbi:MAG: glycosyltransferase [Candidatus Riflebacteria bacterium]|nr:glycosyltransferase [Candidatus Riflebacteria bacterium]
MSEQITKRKMLVVTTIASTIRAFLLPYIEFFREKGWEIHALSNGVVNCEACNAAFNKVFDVGWRRNPFAIKDTLPLISKIRNIVQANNYDIVHVHTPVASFITRLALSRLKAQRSGFPKVVYTAHGFHFFKCRSFSENWLYLFLEKLAGKWTDALIVINREDEETAKRFHILPDEKIFCFSGIGLDLRYYKKSDQTESGPPNSPYFLSIGELNPGKRHEDIILAFARLSDEISAKLIIVGEGSRKDALHKLIIDEKIETKVSVFPCRQDIRALLENSIALIMASEREGLSRIIMEAQAIGTPVIGTNARGIQELLDGGAGLIYPIGNVDTLMKHIKTISESPEIRSTIVKKASLRIQQYEISRIIKHHEDLYQKILSV